MKYAPQRISFCARHSAYACVALLVVAFAGPARSQTVLPWESLSSDKTPAITPSSPSVFGTIADANVQQTSCASCDAGLFGHADSAPGDGGCASCGCGGNHCVPGRKCCDPGVYSDFWPVQCWCRFYECICCPDPCYEPHWVAGADAAFFVDSARPVTQTRLRWDGGFNMTFPDRSEYFWARTGGNGGKGPKKAETRVDYDELTMYVEGAASRFSASVETPYRSLETEQNGHFAGFADIRIGTKSLLVDCELMQLTLGFKTYVPSGNFTKGLGTGHVSLEPSLLTAIKLGHDSYFQGQLSEWIPLGGDPTYSGAILHYHMSYNHVLWRGPYDLQFIGTAEFNGYSFQDGAFSNPALVDGNGNPIPQSSTGSTYLSAGPGLRCVMCDKIDLGIGVAFSFTDANWAQQLYRVEFRYRF